MLELKDGTIAAHGKNLIGPLSFVAKDGEVTCLVGESGTGKTLLMRALLGFWPLERGFATLDGEPVTPQSGPWLRRMMAYIPCAQQDDDTSLPYPATEGRRVLLADDPFLGLSADAAAALASQLMHTAADGLAVVVACSKAETNLFTQANTKHIQL